MDSFSAVKNHEVKENLVPSSYHDKFDSMCDPADMEVFLREQGFTVARQTRSGNQDLKQVATMMKHAKIFIACISDQYVNNEKCRMEFQYAKSTLRKPVIPLVVGDGSFNWTASVVGLLIAGELFIHFRDKEILEAKNAELLSTVRNYIPSEGETDAPGNDVHDASMDSGPADIFLSYCWSNSLKAKDAKQITNLTGNQLSDPRFLKERISKLGYNVWLDVEQLKSADPNAGLFGQIADGLNASKVVIPCISDEYSKSQNCRMEFQFALKSLNKPVVPIVVGQGDEWKKSVIGALIATHDQDIIDFRDISDSSNFEHNFEQVRQGLEAILGKPSDLKQIAEPVPTSLNSRDVHRSRAPKVGDHVISHHFREAYYMATITHYDNATMTYTIEWDDGDESGLQQPFNRVSTDKPPDQDDIGVGSIVFFRQGGYGATEGSNTGGVRYHEGEVTDVEKSDDGQILVTGHHTKGEEDGKWVTYKYYSYYFDQVPLSDIRQAPTALEVMIN